MAMTAPVRLEDHAEFEHVKEIMVHFQVSTGLTALVMDLKGDPITRTTHQKLCEEFHQQNQEAKQFCRSSNKNMAQMIRNSSGEEIYQQVCANGLVNVAVPVVVGNDKVAAIVLGEFFLEEPDLERFRMQAKQYVFDEEAYLHRLQDVPILSEGELNRCLSFLQLLTEHFAEMFRGIQARDTIRSELSAVNQQMEMSLQQLQATEQELRQQYDLLKQKESLLKGNEERWSFAIEGSQDGVWDWDLIEGINTITEQWATMLGYTKEEVVDSIDFFAMHIHPDDDQRVHKILEQFRKGEHLFHRYEFRMRCKDGSYKWILSRGKVVDKDASGKPIRITGTHTDITDWREKMNRLMANRQQLHFVLEGSGSGIWEWNIKEKTIFLDARSRNILGLSKEVITTKEWNQRIDPTVREEVMKSDEANIREKQDYEKEIPMRRLDGRKIWARISGKPVRWDMNGTLRQFSGIITDVTEDKKMDEAMNYQKQILESFFQQSPDAIVHMTGDMVVKEVNKKFLEIFEYTDDECIGGNIDDLIVQPHQFQEAKRVDRLARKLNNMEIETVRFSKSGRGIPVVIRGGTIIIDGEIVGYQAIYTDVSDQRKTEEQLKRALTETVNSFAKLSEKRDLYIYGHQQRVAQLAVAIGRKLYLPEVRSDGLWIAASLHDIGKIIIPSEILSKPSKLTSMEFEFIKTHPKNAYDVLVDIDFDWPIAEIILQHHEKVDGTGYPNGLKDEEIQLEAKILIVADVVEAISSHRPHRPAMGTEHALKEIEEYRGIWYDEAVVDACLSLFREDEYRWEEGINTNDQ